MISLIPYRPPNWQHEGCAPCPVLVSLGLVCHKGNADQQQTSTQNGAQTQGVANQGNGNVSSTGTNVVGPGAVVITTSGNAVPTTAGQASKGGNLSKPVTNSGSGTATDTSSTASAAPAINTGTVTNNSSSVSANGSTITVTDGGAVQDALSSLSNALSQAQSNLGAVTVATLSGTSPATQTSTVTTAGDSAGGSTVSPVTQAITWFSQLATWQLLAAAVAVFGGLYVISHRGKKSS